MGVADASDSRLQLLTQWVIEDLGFTDSLIAPASADASFRRYFRVTRGASSYIVMDAPPAKEDVRPFLKVGRILSEVGVQVPQVLARDQERGLLLLSDLGTRQYLDELKAGGEEGLYADALKALCAIQSADQGLGRDLARYDATLLKNEMELLPQWFLSRHLGLEVTQEVRQLLDETFASLVTAASEQPQVIVHRDYHSRNLLVTSQDNPGIIDFQDAVFGPITYDPVSLLKDCYISWPRPRVMGWLAGHRRALAAAGACSVGEQQFIRWFDLMGLQRHIKVLGIFARLYYRDGKSQYLFDLPLVFRYAREAAGMYGEMRPLAEFLERIAPRFEAAQRQIKK